MTAQPTRNGLKQDSEKWRATQRKAAEKQIAKQRARVVVRQEGNRTTVRRTPLKPVSAKRAVENRQRRKMADERWPDGPPKCAVPNCHRLADDLHEVLSRARGGSITDPTNTVPLCRGCHTVITDTEPEWAYELGLLRHSWDAA